MLLLKGCSGEWNIANEECLWIAKSFLATYHHMRIGHTLVLIEKMIRTNSNFSGTLRERGEVL